MRAKLKLDIRTPAGLKLDRPDRRPRRVSPVLSNHRFDIAIVQCSAVLAIAGLKQQPSVVIEAETIGAEIDSSAGRAAWRNSYCHSKGRHSAAQFRLHVPPCV